MQTTIYSLLNNANGLMLKAIHLCIALSLVGFMWGVLRYLWGGGEQARKQGREFILYGLLALFVMTSLWGIVKLFTDFVGVGTNSSGNFIY